MLDKIKPGSRIKLKVRQTPRKVAAAKTIVRLLSKDEAIRRENQRLRKIRDTHLRFKTRGGRPWGVRLIKQRPVKGQAGESGTILATVDVLRDLRSIERFVDISTA